MEVERTYSSPSVIQSAPKRQSPNKGVKNVGSELLLLTDAAVSALDGKAKLSKMADINTGTGTSSFQKQLISTDTGIDVVTPGSNAWLGNTAETNISLTLSTDSNVRAKSSQSVTCANINPSFSNAKEVDHHNVSGISSASAASKHSANSFLNGSAVRVKVPAKKLREIKSPFDNQNSSNSQDGNKSGDTSSSSVSIQPMVTKHSIQYRYLYNF